MSHRKQPAVLMLAGFLLVTGCDPAPGTDTDIDSNRVEVPERHLETDRHEQLLRRKSEPGSTLTDFASDGCSGGLTIGWKYLAGNIANFQAQHGIQPAWEDCCIAHDRHYHRGGRGRVTAAESFQLRREADLELQACVIATGVQRAPVLGREYGLSVEQVAALYDVIAELMYRAVRIGGVPCSGLPWRWGYGWPACQ